MKRYVSPNSLLQVLEQVEDLRLDRDVERRDRLVADDQLRVQRERARDPDALALAARELVRVAVREARVEADDVEQLAHARRARRAASRCCGRRAARRRCRRPSCAGRATRRDPGRRSASRGASCAAPRRASVGELLALEAHRAARSASAAAARSSPVVDLPEPDSPTRPSVSPARDLEADAVDRLARGRPSARRASPRWTGNRFVRSVDPEQRAVGRSHRDRLAAGARARSRVRRAHPVAGPDLAQLAAARRRSRRRVRRTGSAARSGSRRAGRRGPAAGPGSRSAAPRGRPRPRAAAARRAAPPCTDAPGWSNSSRTGRLLDDLARVHDGDVVGDLGDDAHVVGDQDHRHLVLAARSSSSRSRICAWTVTSSAVVGSSAISSFGLHESAIAIITRWRMPPENRCG